MAWWDGDAPARPKRKSRALAIAGVGLVLVGVGVYAAFGPARALPAPAATPTLLAERPEAIDEPSALLPLSLAAPTPHTDEIFRERLTHFVAALDRRARAVGGEAEAAAAADVVKARDAVLAPDVREALGEGPSDALRELAAMLVSAEQPRHPALDAGVDDEAHARALEIAVAKLDNALLAARLPYFVDAVVLLDPSGRRVAPVSTFAIVETSLYASEGARVRALRLRRLDRANWKRTLMGFVNPYRPYATVLLDQTDDELVTSILPALRANAPMPLLAPSEPGGEGTPVAAPATAAKEKTPWDELGIASRAGRDLRAEAALLGVDAKAGEELGEALEARRASFTAWDARLRPLGKTVGAPKQLAFDVAAFEREAAAFLPPNELADLKRTQARLDKPETVRAFTTLREKLLAAIELHEVQHRLDAIRPLRFPREVDALVPPAAGAEAKRTRVQAELSAYLAQMARAPELAKTTFDLLARFLADPGQRGGAESYAALVAIETLARVLDVKGVSPLLVAGRVDEARLAHAHRALTEVGGEALASAAARAWSSLFGRELATIERVTSGERPAQPSEAGARESGSR